MELSEDFLFHPLRFKLIILLIFIADSARKLKMFRNRPLLWFMVGFLLVSLLLTHDAS